MPGSPRDATVDDLPALLELERLCFPPREAYGAAEYRHALTGARAVNLVLYEDGRLIGFVGAFHHRGWRRGHVYTVNVHPDARGRGVGGRLLDAVEARLRALGMKFVALEVNVANAPAIRLYEGRGYDRVAHIPDYYMWSRVTDAYRYEKWL